MLYLKLKVLVSNEQVRFLLFSLKDYQMWFKSSGIIRYDPKRHGINSVDQKGRVNRDKWWVIVTVDHELCRYYREQVQKFVLNPLGFEKRKDAIRHGFHFIDLPSWGAHCSVIRGEQPDAEHMHLWKKYDGVKVEFEYEHYVRQTCIDRDGHDNYWFVDVRCDFLNHIREELGKPTGYRFHITVGRTWND